MKLIYTLLAVFAVSQARAALLNIESEDWRTAVGTQPVVEISSSTSGTSASAQFTYTRDNAASSTTGNSPGGIVNSLSIGSLGLTSGDYIKLSFSVTASGATTDPLWNRAFSFGFADWSGKGVVVQTTLGYVAPSTTSVVNINYRTSTASGIDGTVFNGAADGVQRTTNSTLFGSFVTSITSSYELVLTRLEDGGATISLLGTDANNNVFTANSLVLTADAYASPEFDTLLFGVRNGYNTTTTGTLTFNLSNIQVDYVAAVPEPHVTSLILIGAVAGGFLIRRRRAAAQAN